MRQPIFKFVVSLLAATVLATACGGSDRPAVESSADQAEGAPSATTVPAEPTDDAATTAPPSPSPGATSGGDEAAPAEAASEREILAGVNIAIADVALDEIVFDTFDGGSVTLADASEAQVAGLLNAIPPIDDPQYMTGATADWLTGEDIVLGYLADDGTAWAHPHRVLNFHEIVNTTLGDRPVAVTYCPLCGSGVVFDRRPDDLRHDGVLTFDNTSALYESDMVMVDEETHTYWWQVSGRGLVGNLTGTELTALPSTTTSWSAWLEAHPATMVLSNDQGLGPRYAFDPFVDYATIIDAGRVAFPVGPDAFADRRLAPSTRVIGFELDGGPAAVAVLANSPTLVPLPGDSNLVVLLDGRGGGALYETDVSGQPAQFATTPNGFVDSVTESTWNAAGQAVDGPATGDQLTQRTSRTAFWFAWVSTTEGQTTRLFGPDGEITAQE